MSDEVQEICVSVDHDEKTVDVAFTFGAMLIVGITAEAARELADSLKRAAEELEGGR